MKTQRKNWSDYEPRWKALTAKSKLNTGPMAQLMVIQWMEERSTWCKNAREMIKAFNTATESDQAKFLNWTAGKLGIEWLMADIKDCQEKSAYFAELKAMSNDELVELFS